jgi:hypothetical protein
MGLDFMQKRGVGFKGGHTYRTGRGYSKLDLYYVRDTSSYIDEGRIYARGWQEINEEITIRYRTEYISDFQFNYLYDRRTGTYEYKERELYYQLGLEYAQPRYLASFYVDRKESWGDNNSYNLDNYILPGVKFQLYPLYMSGKLRFRGNIHYYNEYFDINDEWKSVVSWNTKIDRTYRLNMGSSYYMTLVPGVGYDGTYRDKLKRYYSMTLNMQQGFYRMFFIDADYLWKREMESSYTITENIVKYDVTYSPNSRFSLSSESSYDFRETVDKPVGNFLNKMKYRYAWYSFFIRNRYDYYSQKSQEWLFETDIKNFSETRVKYNHNFPSRLEINQRFNFLLYKLDVSLGSRVYIEKYKEFYKYDDSIENSISVKFNLHCWDAETKLLKRGDETEFWLLFNIAALKQPRVGVYSNVKEKDIRYIRQ